MCRKGTCLVSCSMEIPKSSSTSSRPLAIGNSGILSGFWGDIFKAAVPLKMIRRISIGGKHWFLRAHDMDDFLIATQWFGTSGSNATQQRLISRSGKFCAFGISESDSQNRDSSVLARPKDRIVHKKHTVYEHLAQNTKDSK